MGRRSSSGGVSPIGRRRIQFDFTIDGVRYRTTLPWIPNEANLGRARTRLLQIKARIAAGSFSFAEEFPRIRFRHRLPVLLRARTCADVFDAFLEHEAQRAARDDLAPVTLAAHTQILDAVWRTAIGALPFLTVRYSTLVKAADAHRWTKKTYNNAISAQSPPCIAIGAKHRETTMSSRFFTGLRPSEQMALVVPDYDTRHGLLKSARRAWPARIATALRRGRIGGSCYVREHVCCSNGSCGCASNSPARDTSSTSSCSSTLTVHRFVDTVKCMGTGVQP